MPNSQTKLKKVEEVAKECSKCKISKPLTEFNKNRAKKDGLCHYCRDCSKVSSRVTYYRHHQKNLAVHVGRYQIRKAQGQFIDDYKKKKARSPERVRARNVLTTAVKYGKLKRQPCEVCGALKVHGHHSDYSKPLDVNWLCIKHHMELHRKESTITLVKEVLQGK